MSSISGALLALSDEGEGWFPDYPSTIYGRVVEEIEYVSSRNPFLLVQLEKPLQIQESGHPTTSGLKLAEYSQVLISSRWLNRPIRANDPVSVFLILLPSDQDPISFLNSIKSPHRWASCEVQPLDS